MMHNALRLLRVVVTGLQSCVHGSIDSVFNILKHSVVSHCYNAVEFQGYLPFRHPKTVSTLRTSDEPGFGSYDMLPVADAGASGATSRLTLRNAEAFDAGGGSWCPPSAPCVNAPCTPRRRRVTCACSVAPRANSSKRIPLRHPHQNESCQRQRTPHQHAFRATSRKALTVRNATTRCAKPS
jgi:hypothetical protein